MPKIETLKNGSQITIYPATKEEQIMVYFHGGGLVYGSKSDLPHELVTLFNKKNYTVIAIDYLLAPNSDLKTILQGLQESFQELREDWLRQRPFSFCGRSAGSYLLLLLTRWLQQKQVTLPKRLVTFYGYYDLAFIDTPRNLSPVSIKQEQLKRIDTMNPCWDDPTLQRYLLYLYGVEHSQLATYYGVTAANQEDFQLSLSQLATFPPIFATASSSDQEVPFKYSKTLGRLSPENQFKAVYYLPHDFLKESQHPEVQAVLASLEKWL